MAASYGPETLGQGESEQEVRHRQEQALLLLQPLLGLPVLAFWAMTVSTGVISNAHSAAGIAAIDVAAQMSAAAV